MDIKLRECFYKKTLTAMNFLNEVVMSYPKAVSFAPGRPLEDLFDVSGHLDDIHRFAEYYGARRGMNPRRALDALGQYGRTNGIIGELIADNLLKDEQIKVPAESIAVTNGCQEAMALLLVGLFEPGRDVLLVADPTYIGITSLAELLGIELYLLPHDENGLDPNIIAEAAHAITAKGKRARAVYLIPDFNNPLGTYMPLEARGQVLEIAHAHGMLVFEDNPYGMFVFNGKPLPTLKALDTEGSVIYMGTFSKTLFPGMRLGYLVADQPTNGGKGPMLADELSKVKSFLSVNTSPLLQAVVGGTLLRTGGSLRALIAPKLAAYKKNRDKMTACLEKGLGQVKASGELHWSQPNGGFFLTVTLPFKVSEADLSRCAAEYDVIVCPMSLFSLGGGHGKQIRLSFSYVTPEEIERGIASLSRFLLAEMRHSN